MVNSHSGLQAIRYMMIITGVYPLPEFFQNFGRITDIFGWIQISRFC